MEPEEIIAIVLGIVAAYLFFSGLLRIVRRRATTTRWSYEAPYYAVGERVERRGIGVVLGGIARIIFAGLIGFFIIQFIL